MKVNLKYWICQLVGWGGWYGFIVLVSYKYNKDLLFTPIQKQNLFLFTILVECVCLIIFSHIFRLVLKKINWLQFSFTNIVFTYLVGILLTTASSFYSIKVLTELPTTSFYDFVLQEQKNKAIALEKDMQLSQSDYYLYEKGGQLDSAKYASFQKIKKSTNWYRNKNNEWVSEEKNGKNFGSLINILILITLWSLIYVSWHFIIKNRNDQLDKLKLEGLVKTLELKTIRSHINPHFIFNALNSIRALVDENPTRARSAITELSNILRSSLQADKQDTVPLAEEMAIVNDYLALEQMRFEERLTIKLAIAPDTLQQPIPPMMLQNLVENAIKHGISKDVNGGCISIAAYFNNNELHLVVQNNGILAYPTNPTEQGFGIKSTKDRLHLLYQHEARFEIAQLPSNLVQAKIIMPIIHTL